MKATPKLVIQEMGFQMEEVPETTIPEAATLEAATLEAEIQAAGVTLAAAEELTTGDGIATGTKVHPAHQDLQDHLDPQAPPAEADQVDLTLTQRTGTWSLRSKPS